MTLQHQSFMKEILLQILFLLPMSLMTLNTCSESAFQNKVTSKSFLDFLPPNINESIILSQITEDETSKIISCLSIQCCIQSYYEAGILVWDPRLRPPNSQKCKN